MAEEAGDEASLAHAYVARGILHAHAEIDRRDAARADFERGLQGARAVAELNLRMLARAAVTAVERTGSGAPERVADLTARDYGMIVAEPDRQVTVPRTRRDASTFTVYSKTSAAWSGLVVDTGHSTVSLLTTAGDSGPSARGVNTGDPLSRLGQAYGEADYVLTSTRGSDHVYEGDGIAFHSAGDRVEGWTLFRIKR